MKLIIRISIVAIILLLQINTAFSQSKTLTEKYKKASIERLNELMINYYVFPDVAKKTENHLNKQFEDGHFDKYEDAESFAGALTEAVQYISKDKHMRIRKNRPYVAQENSPERMIEEKVDQINRSRRGNLGFHTLEMLDGNVAYLDLRGFAGLERGKAKVDSYMKLMAEADAVIIDLSKNGGGSPHMVQYLCSYFFDTKVHLNSLYWREGDRTTEFWTLDEVGGDKMPSVPLFVITSPRTFSAAEEFSYNMQTQKRATLVGQTSGGGANPGGTRDINKDLSVFIPTGKAINPITKTNWEGVGVIPAVQTSGEEAKSKTHELAQIAAKDFREASKLKYTKLFNDLSEKLESYDGKQSDAVIQKSLTTCINSGFLREGDINMLGYQYLMEFEKPLAAESIFLANTILHPNSANVFDSYGEVLMMKGDLEKSLLNYQKAVENARKNDDGDLELFKKNLAKVKKKMASEK